MKKLFKKSIACLLAMLMVMTTLPLTAMAATQSGSTILTATSGVIANNASRIDTSNSTMNIVNDGQDDNFTVGFWRYDISSLVSQQATVKSAPFTTTLTAEPMGDCQGLTFFYVTTDKAETLNNGLNNNVSALYGDNNQHLAKAKSRYGLVQIASYTKASLTNGTVINLDVASQINECIANSMETFTIMVAQSAVGGSGSTGGWSDTIVKYGSMPITCSFDYETADPGLAALEAAITAYENKMANVGEDGLIYNNLKPAYDAYIKACRYRDAYKYGKNQSAFNEMQTVSQSLRTATNNMTRWEDSITGKYGSDGKSKVPTFTEASTTRPVEYKEFYGNILYTEDVQSSHSGKNGDSSFASKTAVMFDSVANTDVYLFYPNTVLLYDGSSKAGTVPVMLVGHKSVNKERRIYTVYPTTSASSSTYTSTFAGNHPEFQSVASVKGNADYDWRGGDGTNTLNFNYAREMTSKSGINPRTASNVGTASGNPNGRYSNNIANGYYNGWASGFQVTDDINFNGKGYKKLDLYWAWYGGSNTGNNKGIDDNMKGFKQANRDIYVLNYKMLADAIKSSSNQAKLTNVDDYLENGLSTVLAAYDQATSFSVDGITMGSVETKGNEIVTISKNIATTPKADANDTAYADLEATLTKYKKVYENGNANNENYTAETWAPFAEAYEAALAHFSGLYTNGYDSAAAANLNDPIVDAYNALVLNKSVVDTTVLERVINNADYLMNSKNYFVASTISPSIETLVAEAKATIWGAEINYGLDSEKVLDNEANRTAVTNYINAIATEVNKAQIDTKSILQSRGKSLEDAIADAYTYEATKGNYSNYADLENARKAGEAFVANKPEINARIEDQVFNVVDTYCINIATICKNIMLLRPSFTLITNGTIANPGRDILMHVYSSSRSNNWHFSWEHTTDIVYFKTQRASCDFVLPNSKWWSYNVQTGTQYDSMLDSITLNAQNVTTGEVTAAEYSSALVWQGNAPNSWPTGWALGAQQLEDYKAGLVVNNNNLRLALNDFKVTSAGKAQALGIDVSGNLVNDPNHDFTEELSVTNGEEPRIGGIFSLNGDTIFTSKIVVTAPKTDGGATIDNGPVATSTQLDLAGAGTEIGFLYFWRYSDNNFANFAGYAFDKGSVELKVGVVDLVTLFDLVAECEDPDFQATANNYTTTSWNAFSKALTRAKSDMDYGNMTYNQIVEECESRYQGLFEARLALKAPASNAKLKAAINAAKDAYNNDQSKVDPATWDQFLLAYEEASAAFTGKYSDTGVRDFATTEQTKIDAIADALTKAQEDLAYRIDFSVVDNAVSALVNSIESKKYTAISVDALKTAIANLTYFNWSSVERGRHYDNDTDLVAAVSAEASTTIPALKDLLVEYDLDTVDMTALDAAKEAGRAKLADPDAFDQVSIKNALDALTDLVNVTVQGVTISAYRYATQGEIDAAVADALSDIKTQEYDVFVDGVSQGKHLYGSTVTVQNPYEYKVDWFYQSQSNTSLSSKKYFSSDSEVTFVVKGDTYLTTAQNEAEPTAKKITFINKQSGAIYDVQYAEPGDVIALTAPKLAFYVIDSFDVSGATQNDGTITVGDNDVYVTANYVIDTQTAKTYRVFVGGMGVGANDIVTNITGLNYNDEISFYTGDGETEGNMGYYGWDLYYKHNGVDTLDGPNGRGVIEDMPTVYAWVEVCAEDADAWIDKFEKNDVCDAYEVFSGESAALTKGKVVAYGEEYTFRISRDVVLLALDKAAFDSAVSYGAIDPDGGLGDTNGAAVNTQAELVVVPETKISIVSNFVIPDDCKMQETGVLFAAKKDSPVIPDVTLNLSSVGTNGIARFKSTSHTLGNQYVISVSTPALAREHKTIGQVGMIWRAYMIYTDAEGNSHTAYSKPTSPSNDATQTF